MCSSGVARTLLTSQVALGAAATYVMIWNATATSGSGANVKTSSGLSIVSITRTSAGTWTADQSNVASLEVPAAGTLTVAFSVVETDPGYGTVKVTVTSDLVAPTILFGYVLLQNFLGNSTQVEYL